jgi:hypothetical protein
MATGMPYGLQSMLKDGHKYFSGVDEAVMKNIDACKGLAQITRTSLGPNGERSAFGTRPGLGRAPRARRGPAARPRSPALRDLRPLRPPPSPQA